MVDTRSRRSQYIGCRKRGKLYQVKEGGDREVRRLRDHPLREMGPERDADEDDDKAFRTPSSEVSILSSGTRTVEGF